ncbi:MAG: hypothetical protein JKY48_08320 [Flavobacteriales bacterium]|nr:hypothetical protein [Flavobacteriales bacterium]
MRIKSFFVICIMFLFNELIYAQTPISLTDQTVKLGGLGEKYFYFGLHEGDQLQLNFEELRKKGLKEIEIKEYASGQSIYSEYEIKKIEGKQIVIPTTGIYQIRFYNASLGKRIGKIGLTRIPVEGKEKFNSTVYWRTEYDTTYTQQEEKYLIKEEYLPKQLVKNESYINSGSNATFKGGKSRVTIPFTLPLNTVEWYYEVVSDRKKEEIERVGKTMNLIGQITRLIDNNTGAIGFALDAIAVPPGGDVCDVYLISDYENASLFKRKQDGYWTRYPLGSRENVKSDVVKLNGLFNWGTYYLGVKNPDSMHGVHVRLEVVAIVRNMEFGTRTLQIPHVSSRKVAYLKEN